MFKRWVFGTRFEQAVKAALLFDTPANGLPSFLAGFTLKLYFITPELQCVQLREADTETDTDARLRIPWRPGITDEC